MGSHATAGRASPGQFGRVYLRSLVAAGLVVDAYVHLHLAGAYDANTAAISQGALFRFEAVAAVAAALLVVATRGRLGPSVAFLVAAGGVGAVLLYQYVDVGALGPFPDMYEPVTYPEKTFSLVAEAVAALAALLLLLLDRGRRRSRRGPVGA